MLKNKPIALLAIVVVLFGVAFASSLVYCESSYTDCENYKRQGYTRVPEVALSPILLGDTGAPPKKDQASVPAEQSKPTCPVACKAVLRTFDDPLTLLTALLLLVIALQLAWMARQEGFLRDSVRVADESADAATLNANTAVVGQMPVLSPYVTDTAKLHPLVMDEGAERIDFEATLGFTFENLGQSPAIVREVRADLFLTDRESLPTVNFDGLHRHDQTFVIPGGARGSSGSTSVIEHQRAFSLRRAEFEALIRDATGAYRRFALIGKVTYDDFLGSRHTRTFCVKMRLFGKPPNIRTFQSQHGGMAYNRFSREPIPESEPLKE